MSLETLKKEEKKGSVYTDMQNTYILWSMVQISCY